VVVRLHLAVFLAACAVRRDRALLQRQTSACRRIVGTPTADERSPEPPSAPEVPPLGDTIYYYYYSQPRSVHNRSTEEGTYWYCDANDGREDVGPLTRGLICKLGTPVVPCKPTWPMADETPAFMYQKMTQRTLRRLLSGRQHFPGYTGDHQPGRASCRMI
jgi:hypothetical protein